MPDRASRRRRRSGAPSPETPAPPSSDNVDEAAEPASPPARTTRRVQEEDLVPRPSKMRYVAIFFAGLLVGRIASENFAPGALGVIDLFMYIGLALSVAWAWRSWARRAMIQRHLAAERRRRSGSNTSRPTKR